MIADQQGNIVNDAVEENDWVNQEPRHDKELDFRLPTFFRHSRFRGYDGKSEGLALWVGIALSLIHI